MKVRAYARIYAESSGENKRARNPESRVPEVTMRKRQLFTVKGDRDPSI